MSNRSKQHWPEYLIEACGLGIFMLAACSFGVLLEYPDSPVRQALNDALVRRALMGAAMGLTAVCIIYSPWGRRSGAHLNPAVTLAFYRLGKLNGRTAMAYVVAQFAGGLAGVLAAWLMLGDALRAPTVNFVATQPGRYGAGVAFVAELFITFVLMTVVLHVSNRPRIARFTGLCAGLLVMSFIIVEAPLSGMSLNPARTFGSAAIGGIWHSLWLYFTAPPLGMLLAAELYQAGGARRVLCAKLHHDHQQRCIFHCEWQPITQSNQKKEKTMQSLKFTSLLLVATLLVGAQLPTTSAANFTHAKGQDKTVRFTVRIENVSSAELQTASNGTKWPFALSPGFFAVHEREVRFLREGYPASDNGLEMQAEDGNPARMAEYLSGHHSEMLHGIFNTPVGASAPGPIGPGAAYEFSFNATPGMKLSLATMFGQSNDWFYANDPGGISLFNNGRPISGDITAKLILWDAGTEQDEEPGIGPNQAPRQPAPNTGPAENGKVHRVKDAKYAGKNAQFFKVTITPQPMA